MFALQESPRPDIISLQAYSPAPSRLSSAALTRRSAKSRVQTVPDSALQRLTNTESELGLEMENVDSRCITSLSTMPSGRSSTFCRRVKSAVDREVEGMVNSLAQQCCDVLGPEACHECNVVSRQQHRPETDAQYPTLHASEDNFTKSILVARMMPGMSEYVVQTKLACGEIGRETFKDRLERLQQEQAKKEEVNDEDNGGNTNNEGNNDNQVVLRNIEKQNPKPIAKVSPTFFTCIRDLNTKLIDGSAPVNTLMRKPPTPTPDDKTFTEKLCPSFISPKKIKKNKPRYTAKYDPPLLPKVRQNAEPAFFAGSSGTYTLPERLPESMVLDQDMNLGDPSMSRMSTNYSINPPTPTQF